MVHDKLVIEVCLKEETDLEHNLLRGIDEHYGITFILVISTKSPYFDSTKHGSLPGVLFHLFYFWYLNLHHGSNRVNCTVSLNLAVIQ